MTANSDVFLGRILRSATSQFTFGCTQADGDVPRFGALTRAESAAVTVYGLIFDVIIQDDPFVRQVVAASSDLEPERIEDMRQRRQVPVEVTALAVAYREDGHIFQRVPRARP